MGIGLTFTSAVIIGYIIREFVSWVSFSIKGNRLRSKTAGRVAQIIVVTVLGIFISPLTLDFVSVALSGVYIILLLLDVWFAERVLLFLQKTKEFIINSSAARYISEKVEPYFEKIRSVRMLENNMPGNNQLEPSGPQRPRSQIVIIFQNIFVFSLKIVVYQVIVRSVVLGVSIGIMHFIEKTVEILIDNFLDALIGPIGTQLGHGCNTILFKIPRIILEWIRELLDMLFDGWHIL